MNYQKHYNLLIQKSKYQVLSEYHEKHHIIPECMGGSNDSSNIAILTPEEHYVAHQLLVKIYPDNRKLLFAVRMMSVSPIGKRQNNKQYGWIKRRISLAGHSDETKTKISKTHKGLKRSPEIKAKMSALQKERGGYGPKVFSEEHRLKMSASQKGKHKEPKTEIHKQNLSKSLTGKAATSGFTGKKHTAETKIKMSKNASMNNLEPWETPSVISKPKCLDLWRDLDSIYNAWIATGSRGHRRICAHMNIPLQPSVESMIKWFKNNGNPLYHNKWLDFKKGNICKIR